MRRKMQFFTITPQTCPSDKLKDFFLNSRIRQIHVLPKNRWKKTDLHTNYNYKSYKIYSNVSIGPYLFCNWSSMAPSRMTFGQPGLVWRTWEPVLGAGTANICGGHCCSGCFRVLSRHCSSQPDYSCWIHQRVPQPCNLYEKNVK